MSAGNDDHVVRSRPGRMIGWGIFAVLLISIPGLPGSAAQNVMAPQPLAMPALAHPADVNSGNEWTMFLRGVQHQGNQANPEDLNSATAGNLTLLWSFRAKGPVISQPMVSSGSVFFGSWDGKEYSLNASNGTLRWASFLGRSQCRNNTPLQGITSSATVQNGKVYVGGGGSTWDALSAANGSILWSIYTGNNSTGTGGGHYNWASPLIYRGFAYVGIASFCDTPLVQGQLLKVDLKQHRIVQVFNTTTKKLGATIWASPAVSPTSGDIFVATGNQLGSTNSTLDDSILSIDSTHMTLDGRFQVPYALRVFDGDFGASPTLFTNETGVPMVADSNKNGILFSLRQNNLSAGPVWQDQIANGETFSSAAYKKDTLYVGTTPLTLANGTTIAGSIQSINATTGRTNWIFPMNGSVYGPVSVSGDLVVAGGGPDLVVLRSSDGKLVFDYHTKNIFQGSASIAGGRIYIGNDGGYLYSFGFPLKVSITSSPSSPTHPKTFYFAANASGGAGGFQYRWKFGDGNFSNLRNPSHRYALPGNYSVVLTVTDRAGNVVSAQTQVVVLAPRSRPRESSG